MNDLLALHAKRRTTLSRSGRRCARNARGSRRSAVEEVRAVDEERDGSLGRPRGDAVDDGAPLAVGHRVPRGVVRGVVDEDERPALRRELASERRVEGGDVEPSVRAEHLEGLELAFRLVAERMIGPPVPARRQERLAGLEKVDDREPQGAGAAGGRGRDGAPAKVRLAAQQVFDDRALELRRPRDRRVRRPLRRGHFVHHPRGRRQNGELAVVVEEGADRRVHDDLAARLALRRFAVEGEDRIVGGPVLVRQDEVHHGPAF